MKIVIHIFTNQLNYGKIKKINNYQILGEKLMNFENLRIDKVVTIVKYSTTQKRWRAKNRNNHIIGISLGSCALHDFGYKKFVFSRNHIIFFNQKDNYSVESYNNEEAYVIHFTTTEPIDTESFCLPVSNPEEIISLLNKSKLAKEQNNELKLLSYVYALCDEFKKIYNKTYYPKDDRILKAKEYIDNNYEKENCLDNAVKITNLTPRRFGELFRTNFNTTPNRYIIKRKIQQAKELLTLQSLNIGQIAQICGFSDVYYFSKVFKRETGISPSKYTTIEK